MQYHAIVFIGTTVLNLMRTITAVKNVLQVKLNINIENSFKQNPLCKRTELFNL